MGSNQQFFFYINSRKTLDIESFAMLKAGCRYQKITRCAFQSQIYCGTDPWGPREVRGAPNTSSYLYWNCLSGNLNVDKITVSSLITILKALFIHILSNDGEKGTAEERVPFSSCIWLVVMFEINQLSPKGSCSGGGSS